MDLRDFLLDVATGYNRLDGLATPTQELLRNVDAALSEHTPGGLRAIGSGGKGSATFSPWVGFFDPDETVSPQRGIYVVYLFAEDLQSVTLSLNQGITDLENDLGKPHARQRLRAYAAALRSFLSDTLTGLSGTMQLGSVGSRQLGYEAANIASLSYDVTGLPSEPTLRSDLSRFLGLYQLVLSAQRELCLTSAQRTEAPSSPTDDPLRDFKPKDDSDYISQIRGRRLIKTRRHESLIREYGRWIAAQGWRPSTTEHPKDLILRNESDVWIVEAKILYGGNATVAVRASLGQLYAYRHFLSPSVDPRLLALFSEPIGDAYVEFLESCHIASVWKETGRWEGSSTAVACGLAQPSSPA